MSGPGRQAVAGLPAATRADCAQPSGVWENISELVRRSTDSPAQRRRVLVPRQRAVNRAAAGDAASLARPPIE